jgi:AcrR family transcriptional regulator
MDSAESLFNENLIYSSAGIFERRRRILEHTRRLVAERGHDGFTIRELCDQAKVAPQTVYKAFENKERLVALAIRDHYQSFVSQQHYHHGPSTLEGVVERLTVTNDNMRNLRQYVGAIVSIYFSQTSQADLRIAASYNITATLQPWVTALRQGGHIRRGLSNDSFMNGLVNLLFAAALDWCQGAIEDADFLLKKLEVVLIYATGATRGAARKEVSAYLTDVLSRRERINAAAAHVKKGERRERGRAPP